LRGESGRIARPWTAWLALLGVPAIGVGVFLARRGAIQIDVGAVLVGVLLVGVGASALTALALRLLGTVRVPGSFSATFALRDAGRHQIRVVPGVAAGLGLIAAVVAGMVYIESSRSAAQRMHLLDAPLGGAFVMTADLAEATAAAEAIAPVVQAVPATVAHVPGSFTARADGGPFAGDHESFSTGSSALLGGVGVLVVTPELADVFGFPAETRSALAAGKLATRAGDFGMASGEGTLYFIDPQEEPFALPVAVVLPDAAPAVLAVSEERARELGWPVTVTGIVVMTDRPLTREDQGALTPPGANVELGLHIDTAPAQYALLGAGTALVALLVWALAGLARAEALRDAAIVEAVGAPPGFTRRVAGLQALLQAGLAALAGVPTGIALGRVFLAIREAAVPGQPDAVAIPWPQIAALAVLLPLGVAIVTAITTPVSRRRGVPRPIA
ncbi:MAG: hypothetical protein LBJ08_05040, partial [Bifidobacteriaceae bacterium]|nr:hypothetical protein [Bifidobacteriaceae bacterium]